MTKYLWIKELVENGEYQEAYNEYTKIIEQNPKAYDAYFERALIDCYFLRLYYETSREDLLLVFKYNKRLAKRIPMFLTIICDTLKDYDEYLWIERKIPSDKAERYALSISKEYEKESNESDKEFYIIASALGKNLLSAFKFFLN